MPTSSDTVSCDVLPSRGAAAGWYSLNRVEQATKFNEMEKSVWSVESAHSSGPRGLAQIRAARGWLDPRGNPRKFPPENPEFGTGFHLLFRGLSEWFAKNVPLTIDGLAEQAYHLNLAEKLLFLPGLRRRATPRSQTATQKQW
ncbi:MAG: hypothetical protein KF873_15495 [Gemmataceae bacterium]|nr:hypothetical protein [Gemmataceae bacterium]